MTIRNTIKVVTGIIVVPLSVFSFTYWPKWTKLSMPIQILTGILFLPIVGITNIISRWWNITFHTNDSVILLAHHKGICVNISAVTPEACMSP